MTSKKKFRACLNILRMSRNCGVKKKVKSQPHAGNGLDLNDIHFYFGASMKKVYIKKRAFYLVFSTKITKNAYCFSTKKSKNLFCV